MPDAAIRHNMERGLVRVQRIGRLAAIAAIATAACLEVRAVDIGIGRVAIERALEIARGNDDARRRFHSRYLIPTGNPTVQSFEVITEFRRVVLGKEAQAQIGNHLFATRDAEDLLKSWRGRLLVVAHLRFNPLNAFVSVPRYEMSLTGPPGTREILPLDTRTVPFYAEWALIGADIEGTFDAGPLAQATRTIVVTLSPNQVAAATINFATIE